MEYGDHEDKALLLTVEHDVRKTGNDGFPHIFVHGHMQFRVGSDSLEDRPNLGDEPGTETASLLLILIGGRVKLRSGLWEQPDGKTHLRSRARASASTCSQGMAACGLA